MCICVSLLAKQPNIMLFRKYDEETIYEIPPPKYQTERILKILLDPTIPPSKICSVRPTRISKSATYVVDISKLKHPDDIKNDMFGSWKHSGSHPQTYKHKLKMMDMFELRNVLKVQGEALLFIYVDCTVYILQITYSND